MKTAGWICIVLGSLSLLGKILAGGSAFGPFFWIGLGLFLLHHAKQKAQEKRDKENWIEQ